jgi:hypothetical protein
MEESEEVNSDQSSQEKKDRKGAKTAEGRKGERNCAIRCAAVRRFPFQIDGGSAFASESGWHCSPFSHIHYPRFVDCCHIAAGRRNHDSEALRSSATFAPLR